MIIDANTVEKDSTISTGICIIGAGPAGITLAKEFDHSSHDICLLESGDLEYDETTQSLYEGENIGWPYQPIENTRLRFFGGSSNHWGGSCLPLNEDDFIHRPWVADSGWPFTRQDLLPYYKRAQPVLQLGEFSYDPRDWATPEMPLLPLDRNAISTGIVQHSPPTRFGTEYRDEIRNSRNIRTILNANVTNILTNETATEVEELHISCLSGNRFKIKSRIYILAAGGMENPRILLLSDTIQKNGLGNDHDLVGRYFADHYFYSNLGYLIISDPAVSTAFYQRKFSMGGSRISSYLELSEKIRHEYNLLNTRIHISQQGSWEKFKVRWGRKKPDGLSQEIAAMLKSLSGREKNMTGRENKENARLYRLGAWNETIPRPESRVMLNDERDKLGQRKITLDWKIQYQEKSSLLRTLELFALEVGRAGIGRVRIDLDIESPWPWAGGGVPGYHHMGTTRMHPNPRKGVVDADCKMHGISNLYVAGSSVFPNYGVANPTLTIIALTLKLSDHLKNELKT